MMKIDVLFSGFPGQSERGFLGWSSCVLIRTGAGEPILFDTAGFNERAVLLQKLHKLGISPEDIRKIYLSHYHFDHAANAGLFPNAEIFLHEEEVGHVRRCQNNEATDLAVPYEMFYGIDSSGKLRILKGKQGKNDSIEWKLTPGHTPGLYSLILEFEGRKWVLASDSVKNQTELITGGVAMSLDPAKSHASIEWIRSVADVVVPGHDRIIYINRTEGDQLQIKKESDPEVNIITPEKATVTIKTIQVGRTCQKM